MLLFLARQIIVLQTARQSWAHDTRLIFPAGLPLPSAPERCHVTYPLVILVSEPSASLSSNFSFWVGRMQRENCLFTFRHVGHCTQAGVGSTNHVPVFPAITMQINTPKSELLSNVQSICIMGLLASFSLFFFLN